MLAASAYSKNQWQSLGSMENKDVATKGKGRDSSIMCRQCVQNRVDLLAWTRRTLHDARGKTMNFSQLLGKMYAGSGFSKEDAQSIMHASGGKQAFFGLLRAGFVVEDNENAEPRIHFVNHFANTKHLLDFIRHTVKQTPTQWVSFSQLFATVYAESGMSRVSVENVVRSNGGTKIIFLRTFLGPDFITQTDPLHAVAFKHLGLGASVHVQMKGPDVVKSQNVVNSQDVVGHSMVEPGIRPSADNPAAATESIAGRGRDGSIAGSGRDGSCVPTVRITTAAVPSTGRQMVHALSPRPIVTTVAPLRRPNAKEIMRLSIATIPTINTPGALPETHGAVAPMRAGGTVRHCVRDSGTAQKTVSINLTGDTTSESDDVEAEPISSFGSFDSLTQAASKARTANGWETWVYDLTFRQRNRLAKALNLSEEELTKLQSESRRRTQRVVNLKYTAQESAEERERKAREGLQRWGTQDAQPAVVLNPTAGAIDGSRTQDAQPAVVPNPTACAIHGSGTDNRGAPKPTNPTTGAAGDGRMPNATNPTTGAAGDGRMPNATNPTACATDGRRWQQLELATDGSHTQGKPQLLPPCAPVLPLSQK